MEAESSAGRASRRRKALRRYAIEASLAVAFVAAMLVAGPIIKNAEAGAYLRLVAVILPATVLTIWFAAYYFAIRAMDELEQAMEMRSLAIACGITFWATTIWGLSNLALATPVLPIALIAPLAAAIFGVVRVIVGVRYR